MNNNLQINDALMNGIVNLLIVVIKDAKDLIHKVRKASKSYYEENDSNLILAGKKFNYYELYLEPSTVYEDFNSKMQNLFKDFLPILQEQLKNNKPNKKSTEEEIKSFHNIFDVITDDINSELIKTDTIDPELEYFLSIGLVRLFDSFAQIDHKTRITDLVYETLHHDNQQSLIKAVSVDPNILKLPQISKYIANKTNKVQSEIHRKISTNIDKSYISNNYNSIREIPLFYINLMDSIGLLDILSFNIHENIAESLGILNPEPDIIVESSYFRKLINDFKKSRNKPKIV